jgi:hypothetical protein
MTTKIKIDLIDPFSSVKPNKLQQCMLSLDLSGPGTQFRHIISGRGGSKTTGIVLFLLQRCLKEKIVALYLSPTYKMILDNLLPIWQEVVDPILYSYNSSEKKITLVNGSQIWLRSRMVDNPSKARDSLRGISCSIIVDDEAAIKFDRKFFTTALACLRRGSVRAYISATTPKISEYSDMISGAGHKCYVFKTANNPHLPDGFIETAKAEMSDFEYKREILGEFVELGGRVFQQFSSNDVNAGGNIVDYYYDSRRPYFLSMDIGSSSASMVLWQQVNINGTDRFIAFSEFHGKKSDDNSAKRLMEMALNKYGTPIVVVGGSDLVARSSVDATNVTFITRQIFGPVQIMMPQEHQRSKEIQYDCVCSAIVNGSKQRKLLVARNIDSYDPEGRGILKMFQNYAWPDNLKKNEIFPNDKKFEHVADAVAYFTVCKMLPPKMIKTNFLGNN